MARRAARPYRIYPSRGVAYLDATIAGQRIRESLDVAYVDGRGEGPSREAQEVFAFMYETGLRPSTIARLDVPRSWSPGQRSLVLHAEDDKARYGREVPMTDRAVEILERCAPEAGLVVRRRGEDVTAAGANIEPLADARTARLHLGVRHEVGV